MDEVMTGRWTMKRAMGFCEWMKEDFKIGPGEVDLMRIRLKFEMV